MYIVSYGGLVKLVKAKTPENAIKIYINHYSLPEEGHQREQISVEFVGYGVIE